MGYRILYRTALTLKNRWIETVFTHTNAYRDTYMMYITRSQTVRACPFCMPFTFILCLVSIYCVYRVNNMYFYKNYINFSHNIIILLS